MATSTAPPAAFTATRPATAGLGLRDGVRLGSVRRLEWGCVAKRPAYGRNSPRPPAERCGRGRTPGPATVRATPTGSALTAWRAVPPGSEFATGPRVCRELCGGVSRNVLRMDVTPHAPAETCDPRMGAPGPRPARIFATGRLRARVRRTRGEGVVNVLYVDANAPDHGRRDRSALTAARSVPPGSDVRDRARARGWRGGVSRTHPAYGRNSPHPGGDGATGHDAFRPPDSDSRPTWADPRPRGRTRGVTPSRRYHHPHSPTPFADAGTPSNRGNPRA